VQVGPGFLASLRRDGLLLNLLAAAIVVLGVVITLGIHFGLGVDWRYAVGMFSGATTNTPSLGAAQQAMGERGVAVDDAVAGYALAYPFGIIGIILAMVVIRAVLRISLGRESADLAAQQDATPAPTSINLEVRNSNLDGLPISKVPTVEKSNLVISRVMQNGMLHVARPSTVIHTGDILLAVGPREELEALRLVVGSESKVDLKAVPSSITTRRILVTKNPALGKSISELDLVNRLGVNITRLRRGEVEFTPGPGLRLQFGDTVLAVGESSAIGRAAEELGDSLRTLNHPQIIPIFVALAMGVLVGSIPLAVPGIPAAVKLGLAGGPLVVAIVLSRLGHFGPLIWHLPISANFILREIGIALFLACVGYSGAARFVEAIASGQGFLWMGYAAMITLIPLLLVGFLARVVLKLNYMPLCGMLAGSMTDPPALAFAGAISGSDAPSIAYATVYPLTMLLRVIAAQAMVLMLM
jgi:putative transport protein